MPTFAVSTSRAPMTTTLLHVFEASHMFSAGAPSAAYPGVAQSESSVAEHARQSATQDDASAQPATTAVAAERLKLAVATE